MDFSPADLLSNFPDEKLVAPKILEKKLNCTTKRSLEQLQICLDALEKLEILVKERGKYRRVTEEGLVSGKLRCSSKGFCFAIQEVEGAEDIYIRETHVGTAWNGDRVLVKVTREGRRRRSPEGEVRLVLERANPSILARVKRSPQGFQAVPLDDRLLFELDLEAGEGEDLAPLEGHLVHVRILRYPLGQLRPVGQVTRSLESESGPASDLMIICCKHDLPQDFPAEVLLAADQAAAEISPEEFAARRDLRSLFTVALKPNLDPGVSNHSDNAITLEELPSGLWRLGIHVADVAHFVTPQSPLDQEAERRTTAVHLGDQVLPLLPANLTERCCALIPGQDRLSISVLLTLTASGEIVTFEIQPTVVQVDEFLSYAQARDILQAEPSSDLHHWLGNLRQLSGTLGEQRRRRGAFELNLPQAQFRCDDEGAMGAMVVSSIQPVRSLVAEVMILANQVVASHLQALGVPGIYRVHPLPNLDSVQEVAKLGCNMGIELRLEQEDGVCPQDYQHFTQAFAKSELEKVLTYLLLETLKPASYSTTPRSHFALALDQGYTHFVSPLHRYPDLLIQRVLKSVFALGRDRRSTRTKEQADLRSSICHGKVTWKVLPPEVHEALEQQFASQVVHLTEREKEALEAEKDMEGLQKAGFMEQRTGEIFHGLIIGVQSYGLFVEIEELLVEGLVHVSSLKDDWYEYRARQQALVGRRSRRQYSLGGQVLVQVKGVDYYRQQIDLVIIPDETKETELDLVETAEES